MEIRAYPFLQQESQAPRTGENKDTPPGSRRNLSLPEEDCSVNNGVLEKKRTQIRTHLAQVHSAQEELSLLQKDEKILVEAEKLYQQIGQLLKFQESEAKIPKMDMLNRYLGKVRDLLTKMKPDTASGDRSSVLPETGAGFDETSLLQLKAFEKDLVSYLARLEEQRQKLAIRQKELITAIAHNLVAVENITASSSGIRDDLNAKQILEEVKDTLASIPHTFTLGEANRQNIAALLR